MKQLKSLFGTNYSITYEEWTPEDTDDLKMLLAFPKFSALRKLINNRIHARTEDLVNGKDTRDRIDELKDLILELQNYENT